MATGKKKVIVYTDWINQFKDLTDEEAGRLIKHFFEYINDLNPTSDRLTELLFNPIKATLKRDLEAWESKQQTNKENGLKGGRPKKNEETQNNPNNPVGFFETQNNPEKGDSVSDSVNVNVSVNDILLEKETKEKKIIKKKSENFIIPEVEEIKDYCFERNNKIDANSFFDFYQSKGWMIGKTKMKDWKAAVRTWEKNNLNKTQNGTVIDNRTEQQKLTDTVNNSRRRREEIIKNGLF